MKIEKREVGVRGRASGGEWQSMAAEERVASERNGERREEEKRADGGRERERESVQHLTL